MLHGGRLSISDVTRERHVTCARPERLTAAEQLDSSAVAAALASHELSY